MIELFRTRIDTNHITPIKAEKIVGTNYWVRSVNPKRLGLVKFKMQSVKATAWRTYNDAVAHLLTRNLERVREAEQAVEVAKSKTFEAIANISKDLHDFDYPSNLGLHYSIGSPTKIGLTDSDQLENSPSDEIDYLKAFILDGFLCGSHINIDKKSLK